MDVLPILSTLRRHKITALLVILEIALTCAIVCNAVFLIGQRLQRMDTPSGIAEHELICVQLTDIAPAPDAAARTQEDLAALRQIPGVTAAASVDAMPFGSNQESDVWLDPSQRVASMNASLYYGENLTETLGVHLIAGRALRPDDYRDMAAVNEGLRTHDLSMYPHVALVTRAVAERLWPGQGALGKTLYLYKGAPVRVVGVIDTLVRTYIPDPASVGYSLVLPIRVADGSYVLRTAPAQRASVLAAALGTLKRNNPRRVVLLKSDWEHLRNDYFRDDRAMAGLLLGVCVALLGVTALGIVGLGSFWVAQRRRQIGVRRALGATRTHILRYFQTENFLLTAIGIGLGALLAYAINVFLMVHYELPHLPPGYLLIGAIALWAIGQLAVLGPALRAAAVPPVVATRSV